MVAFHVVSIMFSSVLNPFEAVDSIGARCPLRGARSPVSSREQFRLDKCVTLARLRVFSYAIFEKSGRSLRTLRVSRV
jgi:hypothetical protein